MLQTRQLLLWYRLGVDQQRAPCQASRHLSARLFFDQKMPAITPGGTYSTYSA
jgi:hypothetical protein